MHLGIPFRIPHSLRRVSPVHALGPRPYISHASYPRGVWRWSYGHLRICFQMRVPGASSQTGSSVVCSDEHRLRPNGPKWFIHITTFQHICLQAGVFPKRSTRLFWFYYDFRRNPKSHGFYTIAHRSGRSDWCFTNSSNKKSHTP